jgi:hypothetical protein
MAGWETDPSLAEQSPAMRDYAEIWRGADKIVYSRTLAWAPTGRTRIEREFDPDAVLELKAEAERDLAVGGADLAAQAFRVGWSTSAASFSHRFSWEPASARSPSTFASSSSCSRHGVLATE